MGSHLRDHQRRLDKVLGQNVEGQLGNDGENAIYTSPQDVNWFTFHKQLHAQLYVWCQWQH